MIGKLSHGEGKKFSQKHIARGGVETLTKMVKLPTSEHGGLDYTGTDVAGAWTTSDNSQGTAEALSHGLEWPPEQNGEDGVNREDAPAPDIPRHSHATPPQSGRCLGVVQQK